MIKLRQYELSFSLRSVLGVFWVDNLFVVIRGYKRFGGWFCLHLQVRNNSYKLILSLVSCHSSNVLCLSSRGWKMSLLEKTAPHENRPTQEQEFKNVKNMKVEKLGRIIEGKK